jgi:hypothetical protein
MKKTIEGWISWMAAKSMQPLLGSDHDLFMWACEYGKAEDMQAILANTSSKPEDGYQRPIDWSVQMKNPEVLRVLLAADKRTGPFETPALTNHTHILRILLADGRFLLQNAHYHMQIIRFIKEERIRQSSVVAWIGTQIGHGWKDLMCDIFVQYTGALYEARPQ